MAILPITSSLKSSNLTPVHQGLPSLGTEAYQEITRRISNPEKDAIEKHLTRVQQNQMNDLLIALDRQDWQAPLFRDQSYPYIALAALQQGKITSYQLGTVLLYWVNFFEERVPARTFGLFLETGAINPQARQLIEETLMQRGNKANACWLTPQEIEAFFEEMRRSPRSDQCFFIQSAGSVPESTQFLQGEAFNIFFQTRRGFMIPSLGMMQTVLNVKFKSHALKLNPCLGESTHEDLIASLKNSQRDLALRFPGVHLTETADGAGAEKNGFTYHDFYHAFSASYLHPKLRETFLVIADFTNKYPTEHPTNPLVPILSGFLIDMEFNFLDKHSFSVVHPDVSLDNLNYIFWYCFVKSLSRARIIKAVQDNHTIDPEKEEILIPTPEQKELIEILIPIIPIQPEYREGCSDRAQSIRHQVEEQLKEIKQSVPSSAYEPYIKYHYPREVELRDHNIYALIDRLWKARLSAEQHKKGIDRFKD